jgi:hypothetical protein
MKLTTEFTKKEAEIIRDALNSFVIREGQYRVDMKRFQPEEKIKNLLQLSERQEEVYSNLAKKFHRIWALTDEFEKNT